MGFEPPLLCPWTSLHAKNDILLNMSHSQVGFSIISNIRASPESDLDTLDAVNVI